MCNEFTWFKKITKIMNEIPEKEERDRFIVAVIDYGANDVEPELTYPLNVMFEAVREDIDNSVRSRNQKRVGQKEETAGKQGVSETQEPPVQEATGQGGSEGAEPPVSEGDERGVSEVQTPPVGEADTPPIDGGSEESQDPLLYKPKPMPKPKLRPKPKRDRAAFSPPSVTEVDNFAKENSLDVDGAAFCDFYQSKGWRVGKDPMNDWHAAARNWSRRNETRREGGNVNLGSFAKPAGTVF